MRREYHSPLREMPQFRFKNPKRHYKKLVDRGLTVPIVNILAKKWDTDYETAHKMIRENPSADIHNTRQATTEATSSVW